MSSALQELVFKAIKFSYVALEDGFHYERDGEKLDPEDFFMNYSEETDDLDWETLAQRVADRVGELEEAEKILIELEEH